MSFELITLGRLELRRGETVVLARRRKELALLAYLARHSPRSVDRAEAATLLWGDRDDAKARLSLRQALFELRGVLGDDLEAENDSLRLRPGVVRLDLAELETAVSAQEFATALERWAGPLLPGCDEFGDERWRTWLESERAGLRARLTMALGYLAVRAEERREWDAAADWSSRQLENDPHDEPAAIRLIRALNALGRPVDATAAADRFRQQLRTDLDLAPGPEFVAATGKAATVVPAAGPGVRALVSPDLVGREAALTRALAVWESVAKGGSGAIFTVAGEAGLGKSRFVAELERALRQSGDRPVIASTRAFQSQREDRWSTMRPLVASLASRARGLVAAPPDVIAAAASAIPELAERFNVAPARPASGIDPSGAIARLIREAGTEQPVALFIDDAPDADGESLRVLIDLIRHPPSGVLLVMAGRPDAWGATPLGVDLAKDNPPVTRIVLGPLTGDQVRTLVSSMAPFEPRALDRAAGIVADATGGVPSLVVAAVEHLAGQGQIRAGPSGAWIAEPTLGDASLADLGAIRDRIRTATADLSAVARSALETAAVAGPVVDRETLERASGLEPDTFARAIGELLSRRILRELTGGSTLEFVVAGVRDQVYHDLDPAVRRRHHAGLASVLRTRGAPTRDIQRHLRLAGRAARRVWWTVGVTAAVAAGLGLAWLRARPAAALGPGTGVLLAEPENLTRDSLFDGSLAAVARVALQQTGHVWLASPGQASEALTRMGRPADSKITGELAREIALRENLPVVVSLSLGRSGSSYQLSGRLTEAGTGRDLASHSVRARSPDDVPTRIRELSARMLRELGSSSLSIDSLPRLTTPSLPALRLLALGQRAWDRGDPAVAQGHWMQAIKLDSTFAMAHAWLGYFRLFPGNDRPAALSHYDAALRFADRLTEPERLWIEIRRAEVLGLTERMTVLSGVLAERFPTPGNVEGYGLALYRKGHCLEAIPVFRRAAAMRPTSSSPWLRLATCLQLVDSAPAAVAAYLAAERSDSTVLYRDNVNQEFGRALLLAGRPQASESVFRRMSGSPGPQPQSRGLRSLAYLALSDRRLGEAIDLLADGSARLRLGSVAATSLFRNDLLTAEALVGLGQSSRAVARLRAAEEYASQAPNLEAPFAHYAAAIYASAGDLPDANRWVTRIGATMVRTNAIDSVHLRLARSAVALASHNPRAALDATGPIPAQAALQFLGTYWTSRGRAYLALGQADSALKAFHRAQPYFTWGSELQYYWEQLPLLIADAALTLGDSAEARRALTPLVAKWQRADSDAVDLATLRRLLTRLERPGSRP